MNYLKLTIKKGAKYYLSLSLLISMMSMLFAQNVKAAPDSALYFNPSSVNTIVGSNFNLVAVINPGNNAVTGVALYVTFDNGKMRLDSIAPSSSFPLVLYSAINNTNGTARIDLAVSLGSPPVTTISNVATFAFTALGATTNSSVAFTDQSIATAQGEEGNVIVSRTGATVTITDTSAPVRSLGSPSGSLSSKTKSVTLSLATNEAANCKYSTIPGTAYSAITGVFLTTGGTNHSQNITGISEGKTYSYYVRCIDPYNNVNTDDYVISFKIEKSDSDSEKEKPKRVISNSPKKLKRGEIIIERGKRFSKNSDVKLYFQPFPGGPFMSPHKAKTDSSGRFEIRYKIPYYKIRGVYKWYAVDVATNKKSNLGRYIVE